MAEMEKEGRPPENKRSRKPAHPVKREINEEMKNFAENTMNELLGWYGYDKVELKDGEDIEFRSYPTDGESRQHISVLKENSLPKPKLPEDSVISSYNISAGYSGLATGNGLSDSPAGSKDHGNVPIIVPLIPPPFIKPPAEDDVSNVQIMCAWCQKVGIKRYSLSMGSEVKSFCSEKCFAACRRAYFKRNKLPVLSAKEKEREVFQKVMPSTPEAPCSGGSTGKALRAAAFTTSMSKSSSKHLPSCRESATVMVVVLPTTSENLVPALPRTGGFG